MSGIQKVIKYSALAFAVSLIVMIISAILFGINSAYNVFISTDNNESNNKDIVDLNVPIKDIFNLEIDLDVTNLTIKEGESLKVETNNKYIKTNQNGNILSIKEKDKNLFASDNGGELIIYVPKDYIFNKVEIDMGAGKLNIHDLTSRELELDLGAGKSIINNLDVLNSATLDGGVGSIDIIGGVINNMKLEVGVGNINLDSIITGSSYINAGVGKLYLNILDSFDNYRVSINKGLGSAELNGSKMEDNVVYGTGYNIINIDGGIGSISVKFDN